MGPVVTSTIEYVWRYTMVHRQVHTLFTKDIKKEFGGGGSRLIMYTSRWGHNGPTVAQLGSSIKAPRGAKLSSSTLQVVAPHDSVGLNCLCKKKTK